MVELLYVWVNHHKNLHQQGFHFSNQINFDFNLNQLEIQVNPNALYIPAFWGKSINNITLITGENGAGKSTIIHFVKELFTASLFKKSDEVIVALRVDSEIQIHCYKEMCANLRITGLLGNRCSLYSFNEMVMGDVIRYNIPLALQELTPPNKIPSVIYYNQTLTQEEPIYSEIPVNTQLDISSKALLQTDIFDSFREEDGDIHESVYVTEKIPSFVFSIHQQNEIRRQLAYICFEQQQEDSFGLDFTPKFLTISPRFYHAVEAFSLDRKGEVREFSLPKLDYLATPDEYPDTLQYFGKENTTHQEALRNGIFTSLFLSCFHYATFRKNIDTYTEEHILKQLNLFIDTDFGVQQEAELLKLFQQENILNESLIEEIYTIIIGLTANVSSIDNTGRFDVEIGPDTQPYFDQLFDLIKKYEVFRIFDFGWQNISSGENAMLNLFARFYDLQKNPLLTENLIIFIENAENDFHPQWQKKYVYYLVNFLPKIFSKQKLQIILSSHSPFVVSDFPSDSIIFMKRDAQGNGLVIDSRQNFSPTLAAPSHLLLLQAFGLDNSLIGEFASKKINDLIQYLNNDTIIEMDIRTAQKYIDLIGEPLLKKQLQKLLDSKKTGEMWDKVDKVYEVQRKMILPKQEIEVLKKRIEELETKASYDSDSKK